VPPRPVVRNWRLYENRPSWIWLFLSLALVHIENFISKLNPVASWLEAQPAFEIWNKITHRCPRIKNLNVLPGDTCFIPPPPEFCSRPRSLHSRPRSLASSTCKVWQVVHTCFIPMWCWLLVDCLTSSYSLYDRTMPTNHRFLD
jgi:hypothetical protein